MACVLCSGGSEASVTVRGVSPFRVFAPQGNVRACVHACSGVGVDVFDSALAMPR